MAKFYGRTFAQFMSQAILCVFLLAAAGRAIFAASTNDFFAQRTVVSGANVSVTATFTDATREEGEPHGAGESLWWEWTAPFSGGVSVEVNKSIWSPAALVFAGDAFTNLALISAPAPEVSHGQRDVTAGYSKVNFRATNGVTYYIAAAGSTNDTRGTISLRIKPGPANDDFAQAKLITGTNVNSSALLNGATREPGEPILSTNGAGASIWWKWKPGVAGKFWIAASIQDSPIKLALYDDDSLSNLTRIALADWDFITGAARIVGRVGADQSYHIAVEDAAKSFGSVGLRIGTAPPNDDFADRIPLAGPNASSTVSFTAATLEDGEANPYPSWGTVWWEWTAPFNGGFGISGSGPFSPANVVVYTGDSLSELQRVSIPPSLSSTNFNGAQDLSIRAVEGEKYLISLGGPSDMNGNVTLRIAPGPANDDFEAAPLLTDATLTVSSSLKGATSQPGEMQFDTNSAGASVWWKWAPPVAGGYAIDASSASSTLALSLYKGDSLTNLLLVAADRNGDGLNSARATIRSEPNDLYYIRVADWLSGLGPVTLKIKPAPVNDDFPNAIPITSLSLFGSTRGATFEPGQPATGGNTIWYTWTPTESGGYEFQVSDPSQIEFSEGTRVYLLEGASLIDLNIVGLVESLPGLPGKASMAVTAGQQYYLLVEGKTDGGGPFSLIITKALSNDLFDSRTVITSVGAAISAATVGTTREPGEPDQDGTLPPHTLWYEFRAPTDGSYYIEFSRGAEQQADFAIYHGTSFENIQVVPSERRVMDNERFYRAFRPGAGRTALIALYDHGDGQNLSFTIKPSPANDDLAGVIVFNGNPITGTTVGATKEAFEVDGFGSSVWYQWVAESSGNFAAVSDVGSVWVYTPAPQGFLIPVGYRPSNLSLMVQSLHAEQGKTYYVRVDRAIGGPFTLSMLPCAANDDFANRIPLELGATNKVPLFLATVEPNEPMHSPDHLLNTLWWKWVAPASGGTRIQIFYAYYEGILALYTGDELSNLKMVASRAGLNEVLALDFYATVGTDYSIAYGQAYEGVPIEISIQPSPANDDFRNAIPIEIGSPAANIVSGSTLEPGEQPWAADGSGTVWYRWTAPSNGGYFVQVAPTMSGLQAAIFTGGTVDALTLINMITAWASGYGTIGFRAVAGTTYSIAIAFPSQASDRELDVSIQSSVANDDFANATVLSGKYLQWNGTTIGSTSEPGETQQSGVATVWGVWTAPESGAYRFLPKMAFVTVYEGSSPSQLTQVKPITPGSLDFQLENGQQYYFQVTQPQNAVNAFQLRLGLVPANDDINNATLIEGTNATVSGSTWVATNEPGTQFSGIWWKWNAPEDGLLQLSTLPITSTPPIALDVIHMKRPTLDSNILGIEWRFFSETITNASNHVAVTKGTDYFIGVGGASTGLVNLSLEFEPADPLPDRWQEAMPGLFRGGTRLWVSQTNEVQVGPDALMASLASRTEDAWIEAVYPGPGTLKYWVKTSPGLVFAFSASTLDSPIRPFPPLSTRLTNWTAQTLQLARATNIVRWSFGGSNLPTKGGGGGGTAWLDGVIFTPAAARPPRLSPRLGLSNDFRISFVSEPQHTYQVDYSTNLVDWTTLTNFFSVTIGLRNVSYPLGTNSESVFFRGSAK
jgi:hypothetical protein